MSIDITGGASRRKWYETVRIPLKGDRVYTGVDQYDPVLRSHCGLDREEWVFPASSRHAAGISVLVSPGKPTRASAADRGSAPPG